MSITNGAYKKKISVVIPCHNSADYLPQCINSLETQTIGIKNLEIILINDASTDNTYDILLEFEKKYIDSVIVINLAENMRQGGARNIGIDYASGEYLAFLDSDDVVEDFAYETLYAIAKKYDTDIIQFNHYSFSDSYKQVVSNSKSEALYWIESVQERKAFLSSGNLSYGCWNKFYKNSLIKAVASKFAEHMIFEEPPFVYPLFFYAKKIYTLPIALYNIRIHEGSTMSSDVKKNRILDHPESQIVLLNDLMGRKEIIDEYYNEISSYFIWSYYVETIIISGQSGLVIDAEYFKGMQKKVLENFPHYMENPYINYTNSPYYPALDSLNINLSQNQLNDFCNKCAISLNKMEGVC